jgi:hypothetical protein
MAGGWRRLHNEEVHKLYFSPYIVRVIKSKRMRWVVHVTCMEDMINVCKILVGKPERKRPLGRRWRIWEDTIWAFLGY